MYDVSPHKFAIYFDTELTDILEPTFIAKARMK